MPEDDSRPDRVSGKKEPDWMRAVADTRPAAVAVKPLSESE